MTFALRAAGGLLAAALVTGCGGASAPPISPGGMSRPNVLSLPAAHRDARKPGIAPDAGAAAQLLYVADFGMNAVDVYAYPSLTQKGHLTVSQPTAVCADRRGNVWIASAQSHAIFEYSHGGKQIAKISNAGTIPYGCAVNPATGALAVTDYGNGTQPGQVTVYASPSSKPVVLRNPEVASYFNPAYDAGGNLWVTGYGTVYPILSKCGKSSCQTMTLRGGSIFSPGPIVWDAASRGLIVFDGFCHDVPSTCSYPVSTSGVVGNPTAYVSSFGTALCAMYGAAVFTSGTRAIVVGADNEYSCTGFRTSSVDLWSYPAGGSPAHVTSGLVYPWGAAISTK